MLEYIKTILEKVSFEPFLFEKEYNKAKVYLSNDEMNELSYWCSLKFGMQYRTVYGQFLEER